jgi:hypothetical protein
MSLFGNTTPLTRGLIEELIARQRGHGREGTAVGRQWRVVEGPYPANDSPVCVLFQHQDGTEWRTYFAIDPSGVVVSANPLPVYSVNPPAASKQYRGRFVIVRSGTNVDQVRVCLLNSAGSYEWVAVISSS